MIRAANVITGLSVGGAETMLFRLLSRVQLDEFRPLVISLTDHGELGNRLESIGVEVRALGMSRSVIGLGGFLRLRGALAGFRPDIVQTWMYHADLLGGLAARSIGVRKVIWGLRQSNLSREANRRTTMWTIRACARLSGVIPSRIVCGSNAARVSHRAIGYADQRMLVIPNGFDLEEFHPSPEQRDGVRAELGVASDTPLVGLVARFDPQKDHRNFISAAGKLHRIRPDAEFVMCGEGVSPSNETIAGWISELGGGARFHLLGRRSDVARLNAALDIAVSSSFGEGFSNAIGESMASGIPCVVTDVGDSAAIIGDTGIAVPPADSDSLASGMQRMLELTPQRRQELGAAARRRIEENFSLDLVAGMYESLWKELATCAA